MEEAIIQTLLSLGPGETDIEGRERPLYTYDPFSREGREAQRKFSSDLWNGRSQRRWED